MLTPELRDKIEDNKSIPNRSITESMLSDSVKQDIAAPVSASRLDPTLKAYLVPLLKPKATGSVSDFDRQLPCPPQLQSGHNLYLRVISGRKMVIRFPEQPVKI